VGFSAEVIEHQNLRNYFWRQQSSEAKSIYPNLTASVTYKKLKAEVITQFGPCTSPLIWFYAATAP
jgi:hypothetical protein